MQRLVFSTNNGLIAASGLALGLEDGKPFQVNYKVEYDAQGQLGRARAGAFSLVYSGDGHWLDADGKPLAQFDGCTSIDIVETPFTNAL